MPTSENIGNVSFMKRELENMLLVVESWVSAVETLPLVSAQEYSLAVDLEGMQAEVLELVVIVGEVIAQR